MKWKGYVIGRGYDSSTQRSDATEFGGQRITKDVDDNDIISTIANRFQTYLDNTAQMRKQWLINSAFARGQQYCVYSATEDRLLYLQEPTSRPLFQVDMISPWKEHMIASITRAMPKPEAMPSTTDPSDVSAARLADSLLNHYWHAWRFIELYIQTVNGVLDFGNYFHYLNYREDGSRYVARPVYNEKGSPATDGNGEPIQEKSPIGDIIIEGVPPQNLIAPLEGLSLDDKPWVILVFSRPMDYFSETYGEKGKDVTPENRDTRNPYNLKKISNTEGYDSNADNVEYANEIIYLQRPSDKNPDGMIAVVANKVLLAREPWPYQKLVDRYPIEHFHMKQEADEFWARSWVERQVPLQRLYNIMWSILAENADDMAHQKMLIPRQAGITDTYNIPENIDYNYPFKPEFMQLGEMPAYFMNMLQLLEQKIRDVQNYHGASLGTSVSGVRSDVHAQNLQDQDLLPLSVVDELFRSSFERLYEKVLLIAAEKLTEERIIHFTGKNKQMMYRNFKGSMLGETRRVHVRMSNLWMRSRGITRQTILQMYQMGGILDQFQQPDSAKLMRMLEFDMPESVFEDVQQHTEIAYMEIDKMLTGTPVKAFPWQDHRMHLDVKNEFMNSSDFMDLIDAVQQGDKQAEQIVNLFIQNTQEHQQMYIQSLMALAPPPSAQGNAKPGQAGAGTRKPQQTSTPAKE